jgi:recombination protein RecA
VSFEDFMANLDPKTKKGFDVASELETVRYPLASKRLNYALGGGIGAGRVLGLYGNFSSGKSMLCLQSVALWQKMGLAVVWADAERAFDREFAEKLGVDTSKLLITGSKSGETLSNQMAEVIKAEANIVVLDSISAIMPANFIDKDGSLKEADSRKQIGAHSRAIKSVIETLLYNNHKTAVILISQSTTKIEATYTKQIPHGGNSFEFSTSQIVKLTSSNTEAKQIKGMVQMGDLQLEQPIGRTVEAKVEKNKLAAQSGTAKYDIYYAGDFVGIDDCGEIVDMCVEFGIINKSGAHFKYDEIGYHGRTALVESVRQDSELKTKLEKELDQVLYA